MEDRELSLNKKFMIVEYLLCGVIILMTLFSRPDIVSLCFAASFVILASFFVYKTYKKTEMDHLYKIVFRILVVSFICVLINSFGEKGMLTFNKLKNLIIFYSTIIFMFMMINIKTDNKLGRAILVMNLFFAAFYPLVYYIGMAGGNDHAVGISLNFSNPNLAGMWILQSILYLCIGLLTFKSKLVKLIFLVVLYLDLDLMLKTGARNCLIAFVLFVSVCIWVYVKARPKFRKELIAIVNIIPITFLFVYLKFIDLVVNSGRLDFLISEGKTLTSRVEIWERNLRKIEDCWLIGSYYTAAGNTHNSQLVILGSFGAVTLVLTIWFMYKLCSIVNDNCKTKKNLYCLVAFFAVIFMGIGEGAFFSGAMGLYIMACGYIYLARCDLDAPAEEEKRIT